MCTKTGQDRTAGHRARRTEKASINFYDSLRISWTTRWTRMDSILCWYAAAAAYTGRQCTIIRILFYVSSPLHLINNRRLSPLPNINRLLLLSTLIKFKSNLIIFIFLNRHHHHHHQKVSFLLLKLPYCIRIRDFIYSWPNSINDWCTFQSFFHTVTTMTRTVRRTSKQLYALPGSSSAAE